MNTSMISATLATLRYIDREDMRIQDSYSVFEQCCDYVRALYQDFTNDEIETVVLVAMKKAIS